MKLKKMMVTLGVTAAMAPLLVVPTPAQSQILPPISLPITDLVDVGVERCAINALGTCTNIDHNDGIVNMGTIQDSILNSGTIDDSNVLNNSAVLDSQLVAGQDNTAVFDNSRRVVRRTTTRFVHDDDDDDVVVVHRRRVSRDRVVVVDDGGTSSGGGGAAAAASSSAAAASGGGGAAAAASSSAAAAS